MVPASAFERWDVALLIPIAIMLPVCLIRPRQAHRPLLALAAGGLGTLFLLLPGGLHARSGLEPVDRLLIQPRPRALLDQNSPAVDAVQRASTEPSRAVGVDGVLFPGTQALYELESIGGADPLDLPRNGELQDVAGLPRLMY